MSRTTIAALLQKYRSGTASEAERKLVEQWYALLEEEPRPISEPEWKALEHRLWTTLQAKAFGKNYRKETQVIPFWQSRLFKVSVAAAVALLFVVGYVMYRTGINENLSGKGAVLSAGAGMKLYTNTSQKPLPLTLEDGSKVTLDPNSELEVPDHFSELERVVYLSGEAFFEVSENPDRPFLVNTGDITTKVLGTSFHVKARPENPTVEVAVKTGKVSVYERVGTNVSAPGRKGSGVVLTPNHQVVFSKNEKVFLTGLTDNPTPLPSQEALVESSFVFEDVPLRQVLDQLEKAYNIDIEIEKQNLGECPLTAQLSRKDLFAQLEIICAAIQGTYEIKGTTILINGKGC
jgi:transmembrane sensor